MALLSLLAGAAAGASPLQQRQPDSGRLERQLDRLLVVGNVLYVAAHPDDENTRLLAWLTNGELLRAGYLSITRGDGGQNLIGPQQGPELGLIRTQELLAARGVDGAEQLFTRARDFGFSKSPEEALSIWGHDQVLADVVLAIRRFRPDLIITRFSPDDRDTHGHHTASARLAIEAFTKAADPSYLPDAEHRRLGPWKAVRVVGNHTWGWGDDKKLVGLPTEETNTFDPWLGLSYGELAAESRTMHKSQGFGAGRRRTLARESFELWAGEPMHGSLFDGVTRDWSRVPGTEKLVAALRAAKAAFRPGTPEAALPALLEARAALLALPDFPWRESKLAELEQALVACAGLFTEVVADKPGTSPGARLAVTVSALLRRPVPGVELLSARALGQELQGRRELHAGEELFEGKAQLQLPADARVTSPAWLEERSTEGLYPVTDPALVGLPEEPPALQAEVRLRLGGQELVLQRPVVFKWVDPVQGERYRRVEVLPAVTVDVPAQSLLFPDGQRRDLTVTVRSLLGASGTLALELPEGFSAQARELPFTVPAGGTQELTFQLTPPASPKSGLLQLRATVGGRTHRRGLRRIEHAHIPVQTWLPLAEMKLVRTEVLHARRRIGYLPGAGDQVPESLRQAGYDVTLLSPQSVREGALTGLEAVVVGVRAFNVDPQLISLKPKLLAWVESGGTLVLQYLTNNWISAAPQDLGPFPFTIGQKRVTEEEAAVEAAVHPVLEGPNKIGPDDWSGWVQERGLYFAETWDQHYAAPLSMHDRGEAPQRGALLVAHHGKGVFVYTGLSFFRQLPAGVPGAYRLFANLLDHGR